MNKARWIGRSDDLSTMRAVGPAMRGSDASTAQSPRGGSRPCVVRLFPRMLFAWLLSAPCVGCLSTSPPQLERCQTEKKQLLSRLVDEQKRGESLTTELRTANQRLADAEKQLARVVGGAGAGRLVSANDLGNSPGSSLSWPNPLSGSSGMGMGSGGSGSGTSSGSGGNGSGSAIHNGNMAGGTNAGGFRPLQLGAPRDSQFISATPNSAGSVGGSRMASGAGTGSAPNSATGDSRGFDQLAPRNGRSESGWMPRSAGNAANAASSGSSGIAPAMPPR
jgi:hypothetical protein